MNEKIYTACWKAELPVINIHLKKDLRIGQTMNVGGSQFLKAARNKRPSGFNFLLVINNGKLQSASNTVVGKTLWEVMEANLETKKLIAGQIIEIKMIDFNLSVRIL